MNASATATRWTVLLALVAAAILIPFALFNAPLERLSTDVVASHAARPWLFAGIVTLLLADVFLPIPSSIVSTAAGAALGFAPGCAASTIGMTAGCLLAYALGRTSGRGLARRLVGDAELSRAERLAERLGSSVVILVRAVPVAAEASVFLAGVSRMPLPRFAALTTLANLGLSAVYAAAGAAAAEASAASQTRFLTAFAAAIAIPAAALWLHRVLTSTLSPRSPLDRAE